MLTTKIDTFNILRHSNCFGERKNWDSVPCFVPTAAARTIFSSKLWETISPIRFIKIFQFHYFSDQTFSLSQPSSFFFFVPVNIMYDLKKELIRAIYLNRILEWSPHSKVLSMIFFLYLTESMLYFSTQLVFFTKLKFFVIQSAPAYCLNASCQHWRHFSDDI